MMSFGTCQLRSVVGTHLKLCHAATLTACHCQAVNVENVALCFSASAVHLASLSSVCDDWIVFLHAVDCFTVCPPT